MLEKALSEVKERLAIDGYVLRAEQQEGTVEIVIEAGLDACPECLSSKAILESIIGRALKENQVNFTNLNIKLPHE